MPQIITPNPFIDPFAGREISRLELSIYSELRKYKGHEPTTDELKQSEAFLKKTIGNSLFLIGNYSLRQGCNEVGIKVVPADLQLQLRQEALDRASFSAESIIKTTGLAFGIVYAALKKKTAVGKKRSKSAAEHEGARIFFEQRRKGWRLKHGVMKAWYIQSGNPCVNCEDNEEEGPIPITEDFPSGDPAPPGHIGCECLMSLIL